ncbi:hypothetical protein C0995_006389 [Termitomyces sp. Mi166|nr:hypothetical protein C0995_006389 [Termitomyces sp. Mi166\
MHDVLWITPASQPFSLSQLTTHANGTNSESTALAKALTLMTLTAPGFQTSVRRVRITPEIAARIQRGEEVSPEEIARAAAEAEANEGTEQEPYNPLAGRGVVEEVRLGEERNEWLPESITNPKKRSKGKKR